jgi:hypothetical protein
MKNCAPKDDEVKQEAGLEGIRQSKSGKYNSEHLVSLFAT